MTRREKALLDHANRDVDGYIETMYADGTWASCCPFFIDCGNDDYDEQAAAGRNGKVRGCRDVTCVQCWSKEV